MLLLMMKEDRGIKNKAKKSTKRRHWTHEHRDTP
jgi:hypothetical protein